MKDSWVSAALSDDTVVVELLFRLKHNSSSSSQLCTTTPTPKGLHLTLLLNGWGHRQPRSKPSSISVKKADTTTTRCSPTTPLSWSGCTASPSDGGYDESGRPPSSDISSAFRSKGTFSYESKKKRAFTQLEEEDNLLLKETELTSIHVTLNEQRARSENLKRIKFDLNLESSNDMDDDQCNCVEPSRTDSVLSRHTRRVENSMTENQNREFFLPDLNAMPSSEDATYLLA